MEKSLFNSKIVFPCLIIIKLSFSFLVRYCFLVIWLVDWFLVHCRSSFLPLYVNLFSYSVSNGWPNYSGIMLLLKGICLTEVPHREIEEYLLRAMIYHVGNYSGKNFRSDLTSIWMSVSKKWCLYLQLLEMQIFNIEIDVNPD